MTRFRYGDEQHLEEALKRIFRYGQVLNIFSGFTKLLLSYTESNMSQVFDHA